MRATLMYGAGDVRVDDVPDSVIKQPTDALVRVTASCICGSDLWPYGSMSPADGPARMGHEFIGIVEATGPEVTTVKKGEYQRALSWLRREAQVIDTTDVVPSRVAEIVMKRVQVG
jgi:threonine dehydrogenase-like Zn-dependent dehydrogenase